MSIAAGGQCINMNLTCSDKLEIIPLKTVGERRQWRENRIWVGNFQRRRWWSIDIIENWQTQVVEAELR